MEDSISSLELSFKRLTSELHLVSHHVKAECRSSKDKASIVDLLSRLQALESRLPKVKAKAEHLLEKRSEIVTETAAVLLDNRNKMLALSQSLNIINNNDNHSNSNGNSNSNSNSNNNSNSHSHSNEHDYENVEDGNETAQVNDLVEVLKSNALSVDQSNTTLVSVFRKCDEISSINCNSNSIIASSAKSTSTAAINMNIAVVVEGGGGSQNSAVAHASSMNILQSPRAGAKQNQIQQHPIADHSSELMILAQAKVGFMDYMLTEDKFAKLAPNIKGVAKLSDVVKLYKRLQIRTTNQLVSVLKASGEENISSSNSNSNSELVAPMLPYLEIAKLENLKMNDKLLENSVNCLKHLGMATLYQRNKLQLTLVPTKDGKVGGNRPMNLSASSSSSMFGTSSGVVGIISTSSTNATSRSSPGGSRNSSISLSSSLSSSSSTTSSSASQSQAHMHSHSHLNNPPVTLGNNNKIAVGLSNAPRRVHK